MTDKAPNEMSVEEYFARFNPVEKYLTDGFTAAATPPPVTYAAPDGSTYKIIVDNDGVLSTEQVDPPTGA